MSMPYDLILVRHGESVGNVAMHAERSGDSSMFTDEFTTTPGHRWAITSTGIAQATVAGRWLREGLQDEGHFSRYYASPYLRTRQTAGHLNLFRYTRFENGKLINPSSAQWMLNRALRERDWGSIGTVSRAEFESRPEFALSARQRRFDPLYWTPPGGESIAHVAENRVRNILDTLHREAGSGRVLAVTHGETMQAFRLVLERLSDEEFECMDADKTQRLANCAVLHYSITGPDGGRVSHHRHLRWLRQASPVLVGDDPTNPECWQMQVGEWQPIEFKTYDNATLLAL